MSQSGAEPPVAGAKPIPEERAHAALRRAAQLQAEAMERLERRALQRLDSHPRAGEPGLHPAGTEPEGGFQPAEVEAAAVEAGIAPEFIRQALVEQDALGEYAEDLPGWMERTSDRILRTRERSLELSRVIQAEPAAVLESMQRVFPAHPYLMTLVDSLGGHPLQGGVLVFQLPRVTMSSYSGSTPFSYAATAVDLLQLHVTLRPVPVGKGTGCELTFRGDLRVGLRRNTWAGLGAGGVGVLLGGITATAVSLATGLALPLGAAAVALAAGGMGSLHGMGYGVLYRYYLRKMTTELETLLKVVDTGARTGGAFRPPPPPHAGGGDVLPMITSTF